MKNIILTTAMAIFFFAACKKEDKSSPALSTKMQSITKAPWKMKAARYKEDNDPWVDWFLFASPCEKDDEWIFNLKTLEFNEGPTKCDPSDPQSEFTIWNFEDNEKKINIEGDVYDILILDNSTLKFQMKDDDGTTIEILEFTFTH